MRKIFTSLAILAVALSGASAAALNATQSVQKEVLVELDDGSTVVEYQDASLVTPGETVLYRLDYTNDKPEPASDIVLTMPVPAVINYIEGSAEADGVSVVYSADNGQTFSTRGKLRVSSNSGQVTNARAEDITHIRWTIETPIQPGANGTLAFKGVLK